MGGTFKQGEPEGIAQLVGALTPEAPGAKGGMGGTFKRREPEGVAELVGAIAPNAPGARAPTSSA